MKNTIPKTFTKKKRGCIDNVERLPKFYNTAKTVNSSQRQSPYTSLRRSCKNTIVSKCESMENIRRTTNNQSLQKKKEKENKTKVNNFVVHLHTNSYTHTPKNYQTQADEDIGRMSMKRENFKFMYQIGFGGFGKVWKVQERLSWEYYAMKEIQKRKVIDKDSVDCIMNEKRVLSNMRHPFLVNIKYAFQDKSCLYLIMDYLKGADLRYHICYRQSFSQTQTKFILACLILAVEEIHSKGVIHRDIKPQNLVLQQTGYVRLTDFGIAKYTRQLRQNIGKYDSSGTPGYMAPQVMLKQGYTQISDFFAIGVIGYELMLNRRPYVGKNRKEIKQKIQQEQVYIRKQELPENWSPESMSFINKLIVCNPRERLGWRQGIKQLKEHNWMSDINWKKLLKKEIVPPFIPNIVCETKQYLEEIQSYNEINEEQNRDASYQSLNEEQNQLFEGYELMKQRSPQMTPLRNIRNTLQRERQKCGMQKQSKIQNKSKKVIKLH